MGMLPDVDVAFSIGGDFYDSLLTHRGFTHSLFFAPVFGPLLGWLVWRYRRSQGEPLVAWMIVCFAALLSHPLLDVMTPYGTQLLQPFSDARFAVFAMSIIDPVYTLALLAGVIYIARGARPWAGSLITLGVTSSYLFYAWVLNVQARELARDDLLAAGVQAEVVEAFPTIFQPVVRRVVARTDGRDYVGFASPWAECDVLWDHAEQVAPELRQALLATREGQIFDWFAMGWTHVGEREGRLIASDLRYSTAEDPTVSIFTIQAPLVLGGLQSVPQGVEYRPSPERVQQVFGPLLAGRCDAPPIAGVPAEARSRT